MKIVSATKRAWANEAKTAVTADVEFERTEDLSKDPSNLLGPMPFTASADDVEEHGRDAFAEIAAGTFGPVDPYVAPPAAEAWVDKITLIDRMTNAELAKFERLLKHGSPRLRMSWESAARIGSRAPWYADLKDALTGEFGDCRADELLAPTN